MLSKLQVRNTGFLKLRDFLNYGRYLLFRSSRCALQIWLFLKISQYSQKNSYLGVKKTGFQKLRGLLNAG